MEKRQGWLWFLPVVFIFFASCGSANKTSMGSYASMQDMLNDKNFTFTAQYVQPMGGRQITLSSIYTLTITKDSLISDLPYYGRAYTAPLDPSQNDLHFVSNHFDYDVQPAKHGQYIVNIRIKDRTAIQQMYLSVSKKGYANLSVTPTSKQSISYYGTVTATKVKK